MTTTTSTANPLDLILYLPDMTGVVVAGPVAGVWTTTAPDSISKSVLDAAVTAAANAGTQVANFDALMAKSAAALIANATFLAIASPTNAQATAQVKLLTRQVNALIKLRVSDMTDTTGT